MAPASSDIRKLLKAPPGQATTLAGIDPRQTHGMRRRLAGQTLVRDQDRLLGLQDRLHAEGRQSVLIVLQGTDTSGKDGTLRHALRGLNPQGVRTVSFKAPTPAERRHDFLWRIRRQLPGPGEIVIFNRSHYEDVLIAKVRQLVPAGVIERRYGLINQFEAELVKGGTTVVKFCLHISFEEQRRRLLKRLQDPSKIWKFRPGDLGERRYWDDYQAAYDAAIRRCSTAAAPWFVIPAGRKWYRNWAVSQILIKTLEEMDPVYPRPEFDVRALTKRLQEAA